MSYRTNFNGPCAKIWRTKAGNVNDKAGAFRSGSRARFHPNQSFSFASFSVKPHHAISGSVKTTAGIARGNGKAVMGVGILLTLLFIPIHYNLWDKFPLWYHAAFLISIFPLTLAGAYLSGSANRAAPIA